MELALIEQKAELATLIAPPLTRLDYVRYVIEDCRGISQRHMNRAFSLAAAILRTDFDTAKLLVRCAWFGQPERHIDKVGPLSESVVGSVYYAQCASMPGLVKIGFTTDLNRRRDQLSRIHGAPVQIISAHAGTMLQEHAAHCIHHDARVVGEWFKATSLDHVVPQLEAAA